MRQFSGFRDQVPGVRARCAAALLVALLSGCCTNQSTPTPEPATAGIGEQRPVDSRRARAPELVHVVRVIDGDTIEVELHGEVERVRLLCIDTPERGEPGFAEATEHLRSLIGGARVRLEKDPEHGHRDRFGRLLRYVWVGGGSGIGNGEWVLAQVAMIKAGHSKYATQWGASSLYDAELRAAER